MMTLRLALIFAASLWPALAAEPKEITGLTEPFSVVFDQDGTLYGVEYENGNPVFQLKNDKLEFIAGSKSPAGKTLGDVAEGDGGPALKGSFNGMHDLALHPDGRLFIADTFNRRIRVIDLKTKTLTTLGDGELTFKEPYTVSLHPDHHKLLVSPPPQSGKTLGETPTTTAINRPHGARYDSQGGLWLVDSFNDRLLHFPK